MFDVVAAAVDAVVGVVVAVSTRTHVGFSLITGGKSGGNEKKDVNSCNGMCNTIKQPHSCTYM